MPDNWRAVGDRITERLDNLGMQQKGLAANSNVSVATIREIQRGKSRHRNPRILQDISAALEWPEGYLEEVLHGRQPSPESPEPEPAAPESEPSDFLAKLAVVLERRIGRVVDVIYNTDSNVDITIEIRHSSQEP